MAGTDWSKAELWAPGAIAAGVMVAAVIGGIYAWSGSEPEPGAKPVVAERAEPKADPKTNLETDRKTKPTPLPARKPKLAPKPEPEPEPEPQPEPEPEVGAARVLGTYGAPGNGTVFDVIESEDNNLAELFAEGMATTVVAGGGAIQTTLDQAVETQRPTLRACATEHAPIEGEIEITIVVSTGRITTVAVGKDTIANPDFRKCVSDRIRKWAFEPGEAGETSFTEVFES